jgi:hypothetical protein
VPNAGRHSEVEQRNIVRLGDPRLLAGIPGAGPLELEEIRAWLTAPSMHDGSVATLADVIDRYAHAGA